MPRAGALARAAERTAENAILKLIARVSMALFLPVFLFFGSELWSTARRAAESTIRLEEKIGNLIESQRNLATNVDGRFNAQAQRFIDQGERIKRLEDRVFDTPPVGRRP